MIAGRARSVAATAGDLPGAGSRLRVRGLRRPFTRREYVVLWIAAALTVIYGAWLSDNARLRASEDLRRLENLQQALRETATLIGLSADLQANQRGFLLMEDPKMLQQFGDAAAALPPHAESLRNLLEGDRAMMGRVDHLQQALAHKLQQLTETLDVFGRSGRAAAVRLLRAHSAQQSMDEIRAELLRLQLHLIDAEAGQEKLVQDNLKSRNVMTYGAIGLAALAVLGALMLLQRHLRTLREDEALRIEVRQSQRESREKSTFLANMSHEIRTPMNAIFGFSRLLQDRVSDPVANRYVQAITTSARSLLALINDILDLSKIEAGRLEVRNAPMSLRETLRSVVSVFAPLAAEKGLRLRCKIRAGVPSTLMLDAARVRQMLFNLVGNAIKYTDQGEVMLRAATVPDPDDPKLVTCTLEVEDSGAGIPRQDLETIFDAFTQGRGGPQREGSGLGLSITRRLAYLMGGDVSVASELGLGSVFRLTLPRVRIASPQPPLPPPVGQLAGLPPMTVLVVDDVDLNRDLLEALFADTPHRVLTASSGAEAIAVAQEQRPDLVLMDIRMPDMNGIEALRSMRADPSLKHMRVVAVTASTMSGEEQMLRLHFDGFVGKPFSREILYTELAQVLGVPPLQPVPPQPEPDEPPEEPAPPEVIEQLERLQADAWPPIRDTLEMHEVRAFADRLRVLAQNGGGRTLARYADELLLAARHFEVARTDMLLREFPARVRELRPHQETETV